MTEREERLADALHRIEQWCSAYPLDIFPEPDLKRAREVLEAAGMTLDGVSASAARHVLNGIVEIVQEALHD